ncbi:hypothetical protein B0H10DRAFT_2221553 [Mycena sp. CBHHK59/15]|nr:hypothetical protein B0H10DRAFT_2221553 [Mycena sp. CBHHK59/15]
MKITYYLTLPLFGVTVWWLSTTVSGVAIGVQLVPTFSVYTESPTLKKLLYGPALHR